MVEITPSRTKLPAHVVVITPYVVDFPPHHTLHKTLLYLKYVGCLSTCYRIC